MIWFRVLNEDPVRDYVEACRITQGIAKHSNLISEKVKNIFYGFSFDVDKAAEWWKKQIIANHSTIRCVKFRMTAKAPKSVVMQIIRATKGHPQPYVQSSRPDWVGKERSLDPYEEMLFIQDHTAESFVEMCKQRLCNRTEGRTRKFMQEAVEAMSHSGNVFENSFFKALALCCKPACEWYKGCPELKSCGAYPHKVVDDILAENSEG